MWTLRGLKQRGLKLLKFRWISWILSAVSAWRTSHGPMSSESPFLWELMWELLCRPKQAHPGATSGRFLFQKPLARLISCVPSTRVCLHSEPPGVDHRDSTLLSLPPLAPEVWWGYSLRKSFVLVWTLVFLPVKISEDLEKSCFSLPLHLSWLYEWKQPSLVLKIGL